MLAGMFVDNRQILGVEKSFSKNLPFGPLGPPSKLRRVRSSFELGGAFRESFLPPFCPLGPRLGYLVDDLEARQHPAVAALES